MTALWTVEATYPATAFTRVPDGAESLTTPEETRILTTVDADDPFSAIAAAAPAPGAIAIAIYPTPDGYDAYSGPAASLIAIPTRPS